MVRKIQHQQYNGPIGSYRPPQKPMNKDILALAESSTSAVVRNGIYDQGESIENGTRVSCLNASTGALIVVSGTYSGIDGNNNILITNHDKIVGTNTGVIVRKIAELNHKDYEEEQGSVFIKSASNSEIESAVSEELEVGQIYHVRGESGNSITKGVYEGYHKSNRDNVILWFSSGKYVAINPNSCFTFSKMHRKEVKVSISTASATSPISASLNQDQITKIGSLAANFNGAIYQNGKSVVGEIERGKRVLCISMDSGRITYSGTYEGKENGHHLVSSKKIYDKGNGVLFRPMEIVLDQNYYKANFDSAGVDFYPLDKRNPMENIKKADDLPFGELFYAGKGSDHRVIAGGYYLGYHTTDEGHTMLWFSDGNCVDVDREHIIVAPAIER